MKAKIRKCRNYRCPGPPYLGGLCAKHHEEERQKASRREVAIKALHTGLFNGALLRNSCLFEELEKITKWWDRVCRSEISGIEDKLLKDETIYAGEWCIAIAQEIIGEEQALNNWGALSASSLGIKESAWKRFHYLERGLMSNGSPSNN